ncbi:preprotein translocase subunit YajC [Halomonas sp. M20]|uniref:preprotein translocase subunit YajC n=1 Tax=Halomonas sp. M20 TaxID=2763264 RepID=UPI001D0A6E51|nr:preprotein translocase subunit YajC [Halomonas sp. M20]
MALWLIIPFTLLIMLSPLIWLRPSRRDRRLGQLRQQAHHLGVAVKFAKSPLHNPPAGLVSYRWPYQQDRPGPYFVLVRETHASEVLKPFDETQGWRWRIEPLRPVTGKARSCLERALKELPRDALVLESERRYLTLWWEESQSVEAFNASHIALVAVCDALDLSVQDRSAEESS